jgi:hypothetical protein
MSGSGRSGRAESLRRTRRWPSSCTCTAVRDDGTEGTTSDQNGHTVVEADDMDGARALTEGHPFLTEGNGRFTLEIFELMPM